MNLNRAKPEFYKKCFTFQYLGDLLSYYFLSNYRKIDFLVIYENEQWRSFIPLAIMERTLKQGRRIWADKNNFKKYHDGFKSVIKECQAYLKKARKLKDVSAKDWIDLQRIIDKLYSYYEKTEFFFADSGYQNTNPLIDKHMLIVGHIKLNGRQCLNDLLINTLYEYAEKTAIQFNLNTDDVKFYSSADILNLFRGGNAISEKAVEKRKKSYVLYCNNKKIYELNTADAKKILERFKEQDYSKIKEFKGVVACKGVAKGNVRVVLADYRADYRKFENQIHAMQDGEILVTETTSPEFVPAMKKAAGVITNQGGLGSHAAIVSRELNVPCIVGTQNATDILKTGDFVELDAVNNVIKVLKRI